MIEQAPARLVGWEAPQPNSQYGKAWPYGSCRALVKVRGDREPVMCGWPRKADGRCAVGHHPDDPLPRPRWIGRTVWAVLIFTVVNLMVVIGVERSGLAIVLCSIACIIAAISATVWLAGWTPERDARR